MAEHIQIGDQRPWIQVDQTVAGNKEFAFDFAIFQDADLEVYLDGVLQTLTTQYAVDGAGSSGGGKVTFVTAPAIGAVITMRRRLTIQRTTDFQESGEFRARVINDELDYQTAAIQQIADDVGRALRLPATDPDAALELPGKAARSDSVLAFDGNGVPQAGPSVTEVFNAGTHAANAAASAALASASASDAAASEVAAAVSAARFNLANIAAMTALAKSGLTDGDIVYVAGHTTEGDGGHGEFRWDASATDTADGGTIFESDEGGTGRWKRIFSGAVNTKWFGAVGDGVTDDATAIQNALDAVDALGGGTVYFPPGTYYLGSQVTVPRHVILQGSSVAGTTITSDISGAIFEVTDTALPSESEIDGTWFRDMMIDGLDVANGGYGVHFATNFSTRQSGCEHVKFTRLARGSFVDNCQSLAFRSVKFTKNDYGLYADTPGATVPQMVYIEECDFRENTTAGIKSVYTAGSKPYQWYIVRTHIETNGRGIDADGSPQWNLQSVKFEQNDNEAIKAEACEEWTYTNCYFNNNADVAGDQEIYLTGVGTANGYHTFIGCKWEAAGVTNHVKMENALQVKFINCNIDETKISFDADSSFEIDNPIQANSMPNPCVTQQRVAFAWLTDADAGASGVHITELFGPKAGASEVWIEKVEIDVTEAFALDSGTYGVISVGSSTSQQGYSQSQDVTSTGLKTPTMNADGYQSNAPHDLYAYLRTDGAFTTSQGKALVAVYYHPAPPQPS